MEYGNNQGNFYQGGQNFYEGGVQDPNIDMTKQNQHYQYTTPPNQVPITSPQRNNSVPISGWNWGAFMFAPIWGIGNKCYITLLCLIPFLNIIWPFVCGIKGNEWALHSGLFRTVEEFNATQQTWNRAGKVFFFFSLIMFALYIVLFGFIFTSAIFAGLR